MDQADLDRLTTAFASLREQLLIMQRHPAWLARNNPVGYVWLRRAERMQGRPSITCPDCRMTSYNPSDVREGYCGNCHAWTSQPRQRG